MIRRFTYGSPLETGAVIVPVPPISFIAVMSKGDPNQEDGDTAPDPGKAAGTIGASLPVPIVPLRGRMIHVTI